MCVGEGGGCPRKMCIGKDKKGEDYFLYICIYIYMFIICKDLSYDTEIYYQLNTHKLRKDVQELSVVCFQNGKTGVFFEFIN